MKITISRKALLEPLERVQGAVAGHSAIPVLSHILIEAAATGKDRIRLTASDLDTTIAAESSNVVIETPGAVCVEAKKLFNIVRLLPEEKIVLESQGNFWVTLRCGRSRFRLAGVDPGQFPETPQVSSTAETINIPNPVFRELIRKTEFAVSMEQSRFTISGAKLGINNDTLRMVTTDGHRLALAEAVVRGIERKTNVSVLIPKKVLRQIGKLDENEPISFAEDAHHIFFADRRMTIAARKLAGNFPDYELVIPKECSRKIIFDAERLLTALRRVAVMADVRTNSIRLHLAENKITVAAQSSEEGEAQEEISAEYTGEAMEIGFNQRYLQEYLAVCSKENAENGTKLTAEFNNSTGQFLFHYPNSRNYLYVVVPLRI